MEKKILIIIGTIISLIIIAMVTLFIWYNVSIGSPSKNSDEGEKTVIEIASGTNTTGILNILKQNNVIKNELAAKIYITLNDVKNLQAGKYSFSGNETLEEVLKTISTGNIMNETVTITFLEGRNMRYIANVIAENTNNTEKNVYEALEDEKYIQSLIEKYWFLTEDIKDPSIYYPLEGYLYPNTYNLESKDVDVKTIFGKMLDQMEKQLEPFKERIEKHNVSIHKAVTIASIVELEGNNEENRAKIARVIYNRLAKNMPIGSDVTTYYGIKVDMSERDLYAKEINTYNAYNTRGPNMEGKLPIGPIASVSSESIKAALNPAKEDYLYFVADKAGEIYFSSTYEEHLETISTLKNKGLWYEYEE